MLKTFCENMIAFTRNFFFMKKKKISIMDNGGGGGLALIL